MSQSEEVVDLTNSFSYSGARRRRLDEVFWVLDSDSSPDFKVKTNKRKAKSPTKPKSTKNDQNSEPRPGKSKKWGECPICLVELGIHPLASTKCGHVFCMKCLERSLLYNKICPTCRLPLRGSYAYHPLYLNHNVR